MKNRVKKILDCNCHPGCH